MTIEISPSTIRAWRGQPHVVAESSVAGQGFHAIGFVREQRALSKALAKRGECRDANLDSFLTNRIVEGDNTTYTKILSKAAKELIAAEVASGMYKERSGEGRPPYMPPSTDLALYSSVRLLVISLSITGADAAQWCSLCNDLAVTLLLCAGCMVGVCCGTPDSPAGCLTWDPVIEESTFVFYCIFCLRSRRGTPLVGIHSSRTPPILTLHMQLKSERAPQINKRDVWLRCDPPVLIIAITWHRTQVQFGKLLHQTLALKYYNNGESVSPPELWRS